MVAEKLDPTVGRICFFRIFQTVMNMEKRTTEMSSEGQKMVERSYGVAGNGRKITKCPVTHSGRRRRFTSPIPIRLVAVGREISRPASSGCPPPICLARVQ